MGIFCCKSSSQAWHTDKNMRAKTMLMVCDVSCIKGNRYGFVNKQNVPNNYIPNSIIQNSNKMNLKNRS